MPITPDIADLLETLTERERVVIEQRFGLVDGHSRKPADIGRQYKVSVSTISRIQRRALTRLASALGLRDIRDVLDALLASLVLPRTIASSEVIESVSKLTPELIGYLKSHTKDLEKLPWNVFEHLVAEFLASQGFSHVALVGRSKATGADIFAVRYAPSSTEPLRIFIEVKRWKDRVGIEVIERVYGAMLLEQPRYGWHAAMVVALSGYANFARYKASQLSKRGIELKSREDLLQWLDGYQERPSGLWLPKPATSIRKTLWQPLGGRQAQPHF